MHYLYSLAGTIYALNGRDLIKVTQHGTTRVSKKGTLLHWNEETKRWRKPERQPSQAEGRNPEIEALYTEDYDRRRREFTDSGALGRQMREEYLLYNGQTYEQIKQESGDTVADEILTRKLQQKAQAHAQAQHERNQSERERQAIAQSENEVLKQQRSALDRLKPELKFVSLEKFKQDNPGTMDALLMQYQRELHLDKALSLDGILDRGKKITNELTQQIEAAKSRNTTTNQLVQIMQGFRDSLLSTGLEREKAQELSSKIRYDDSLKVLGENAKTFVQQSATDFFQLSGGAGAKRLRRIVFDGDRAYANRHNFAINVGGNLSKELLFHEHGHHIEFEEPRIAEAARNWRDRRAVNQSPQPLSGIAGFLYEANEVALQGDYYSPYVGKVYSDGSTEVVSMGIQMFSSPDKMLKLHEKDKEHFELIVGIIRHAKNSGDL